MVRTKISKTKLLKLNGFTLIELMIVVAVVGILAALTFVSYGGIASNAIVTSQKNALYAAQGELKTYFATNNAFPPNAPNGTDFPSSALPGFKNPAGITLTYRNYTLGSTYTWCATATSTTNTSLPALRYQSTDTDTSTGTCPDFGYTMPAPYAWYKLNGNATDSSGNNFNGTLTNSPTPVADAAGRANSAYSFNGSNQFIDLGSAAIFNGTYSKSAWMLQTVTNTSGNIFSGYGTCNGHAMYVSNGYLNAGHCGAWGTVADPVPYALGQWYFIVVTYNSTNQAMKYYRNGILISSGTSAAQGATNGQIGAYNSGNYFNGILDDVRAYNIELTATQAQQLYNLGPQ